MTTLLLFSLFLHTNTDTSKGDAEYFRMEYLQAESLYTQTLAASANNQDILWRLSRLYISLADVSPDAQREELYRKAEAAARSCVTGDEKKAEGHTWLAASLGNIAMYEGGKTKVRLANEIREELLRAIALNPNDDVAYSILGSFYRALGNVSWIERQLANLLLGSLPSGGYAEAEVALKKAIAIAPNVMRHHFELGMLYRDWEHDIEAKGEFIRASHVPISVRSDSTRIVAIKEMLEELTK